MPFLKNYSEVLVVVLFEDAIDFRYIEVFSLNGYIMIYYHSSLYICLTHKINLNLCTHGIFLLVI